MTRPPPLRVLHLTGPLNRGGIETWLLHLLRAAAQGPGRERLAMDVMVIGSREPAAYDDAVRAAGASILHCPAPQQPLAFAVTFLRLLRQHGPYDAVHSHIHHFGALPLALARLAGVPLRVATSHSDTRAGDARAAGGRRAYLTAMRALMPWAVNRRLAVGEQAAEALYGPGWRRDTQLQLLGLDLSAFAGAAGLGAETGAGTEDREAARAEFGVPPGAPLIGHVGRFDEGKNQAFALEVFAACAGRVPAHLLLVGDGPLREAVAQRAWALGLSERVHLPGPRPDVPRLLGAADAFLFPSHFEGRSLALIEAQLAGLPCLISDTQDPASALPGADVTVLPLSAGPQGWAAPLLAALERGRTWPQADGLDIRHTLAQLTAVYGGAPYTGQA